MKKPKLFLIDLSNISYILYNSRQLNYEGVLNYIHKLLSIGDEYLICCDCKSSDYWRRDIYPQYKSKRKKTDDGKQIKKMLNIIYSQIEDRRGIGVNGEEADDVIAKHVKENIEYRDIIVLSSDSDFAQLAVYDGFKQLNPLNKKYIKKTYAEAIGSLTTKIIRGDRKDSIGVSHNQGKTSTKVLSYCIDEIVYRTPYDKLSNLRDNMWDVLNDNFDMDEELFTLNYKLINLL